MNYLVTYYKELKEMKTVLINPPQTNSLDDHLDPPLGLMYIAANLERNGVEVEINDLSAQSEQDWPGLIGNADVYGITLFSASVNVARRISGFIKKNNHNAIVVAGGPHATSLPRETLEYPEFDHVVVGEGEKAFLQLVKDFYDRKQIPKVIKAQLIGDLDSLPNPARHLVNLSEYHRTVEGKHATSMITGRGCPFNCNFCCKDVHGRGARFRGVENFLEEARDVVNRYSMKTFIFYDDIFTLNRKRLERLCTGLKDLSVTFRCNGRAGVNTEEDYRKLKEAGCEEIAFGIESGSQYILDRIGKGTTVRTNAETIRMAKNAGLLTKAYLVVGFPGETQATVDETKRFMDEVQPDKYTVFQFVPLPGCDVRRNPEKYGITWISKNWDDYFNIAGQYEGGITFRTANTSPEEFRRFHDDLVTYLKQRDIGGRLGQRGKLEEYYKKLEK